MNFKFPPQKSLLEKIIEKENIFYGGWKRR